MDYEVEVGMDAQGAIPLSYHKSAFPLSLILSIILVLGSLSFYLLEGIGMDFPLGGYAGRVPIVL